jgi:ribosomal protein L18E
MKNYVAYYRVSTSKQIDGLGLSAQSLSVSNYIQGKGVLIASFTEIETGTRKKKRIEIYKAIEYAKANNAILIVAKLDRLSRDVAFTSALYSAGVDFVCVDNPVANKLTIQILAVIAENEAEMISKRISEALAIKKQNIANGNYTNKDGSTMQPINGVVRLGSPKGFGDNQSKGVEAIKANAAANKANIQAMDIICSARKDGATYQAITDKLNGLGYTTRYGKSFNPIQVQRLYSKCI